MSTKSVQEFEFEVVTVNDRGQIVNRDRKENYQQVFDLDEGVQLEMVYIPAGKFLMGSPETEKGRYSREGPQHWINIARPFWMGKYPVTQEQYRIIMGKNPSYFPGDKRPVETVSWDEAKTFCKKLSERLGIVFDLPSEAQWEYACRAGTTTAFYFGEVITTELANYDGRTSYTGSLQGLYRKETTEVGQFPPNAFGLYDMHGNVWEWCEDLWHNNYQGAPIDGSAWMSIEPDSHLLRGGSWLNSDGRLRCANRIGGDTTIRGNDRGLRLSRSEE